MATAPLAVAGLVITGGPSVIVKTTPWLPVPTPLVALTFALNTPTAVGVPEMRPADALTESPGGNPLAP